MRPHCNLEAWKESIECVVRVYEITESIPKDERYGLISQIRRASVSIPANIAEGAARRSEKEFLYFLSNAQGSASELETEFIIARRLEYLKENDFVEMGSRLDLIGRLITGLSRHLKRRTE